MVEIFNVTIRQEANYAVIYTEGYINNSAGEKIVKEFEKLLVEGITRYILNLEKTQLVNSIGISILIEIIEKVREINGSVAFCCLTPIIAKTFQIMGLIQYSKIYKTEEEALLN